MGRGEVCISSSLAAGCEAADGERDSELIVKVGVPGAVAAAVEEALEDCVPGAEVEAEESEEIEGVAATACCVAPAAAGIEDGASPLDTEGGADGDAGGEDGADMDKEGGDIELGAATESEEPLAKGELSGETERGGDMPGASVASPMLWDRRRSLCGAVSEHVFLFVSDIPAAGLPQRLK